MSHCCCGLMQTSISLDLHLTSLTGHSPLMAVVRLCCEKHARIRRLSMLTWARCCGRNPFGTTSKRMRKSCDTRPIGNFSSVHLRSSLPSRCKIKTFFSNWPIQIAEFSQQYWIFDYLDRNPRRRRCCIVRIHRFDNNSQFTIFVTILMCIHFEATWFAGRAECRRFQCANACWWRQT